METELDDLIRQYCEKFGDNLPIYMMPDMQADEMADIIRDCLARGEPYKPDIIDGAIY